MDSPRCQKCGKPRKRTYAKFCSNECRRVDLREGYEARVIRADGCWAWSGSVTDDGYGQIEVSWRKPTRVLAHRLSWELHLGQIPAGLFVLHKCDNPPCTNPDHLFLGTHEDNMADREAKGRSPRGEDTHNAVLTDEIVREIMALRSTGLTGLSIRTRLGLGRGPVDSVIRGRSWVHVTGGRLPRPPKLRRTCRVSLEQIDAMRAEYRPGKNGPTVEPGSLTDLSRRYGISVSHVARLVRGVSVAVGA